MGTKGWPASSPAASAGRFSSGRRRATANPYGRARSRPRTRRCTPPSATAATAAAACPWKSRVRCRRKGAMPLFACGRTAGGTSPRCRVSVSLPVSLLRFRLAQQRRQLLAAAGQLGGGLGFEDQPQVGLGVGGADVGPPVGIADGDAVQVVDPGIGVTLGQQLYLARLVLD